MSTYNQLCKKQRIQKTKIIQTPALDRCPQKKGICVKLILKTPRKPNSALRKIIKVKLTTQIYVFAHIPGEGHNLQIYSTVLIRGGKVKDLPGVKYRVVRNKFDLEGLKRRKTSRSKYGTKKMKHLI